jgi:hypothetical protein
MATPTNEWHINAVGFKGTFNITSSTPSGSGAHLRGVVNIDTGFTDVLDGHWDENTQEIVFNRIMTRGGVPSIQTYTGYLFLTKEPIFMGEEPPPQHPTFRMMTGSFAAVDSGSGNAVFGWAARQAIS